VDGLPEWLASNPSRFLRARSGVNGQTVTSIRLADAEELDDHRPAPRLALPSMAP